MDESATQALGLARDDALDMAYEWIARLQDEVLDLHDRIDAHMRALRAAFMQSGISPPAELEPTRRQHLALVPPSPAP